MHLRTSGASLIATAIVMRMTDAALALGTVPIVIGVTGHRYIEPEIVDEVRAAVQQALVEILELHPHCSVILLTALAEGADRLVARVGLDMEGVSVVAPLPMPLNEYRRDFEDPLVLQEFEELLERVDHWYELPMVQNYRQLDPRNELQRPLCYRALAEYIARYSHYAIALWDGEPSRGGGSTAELVNIVLHGTPSPEDTRGSIQEPASAGPVIHILTVRSGESSGRRVRAAARMLYPDRARDDADEERIYGATLEIIDLYNRDVRDLWQRISPEVEERSQALQCLESLAADRQLADLRTRFAIADFMAVYFKRLHVKDLVWLLILSAIGYTCLELYDEIFSAYIWGSIVLLGFPLALLLAWLRLRNSRLWHAKYLNYRSLAEGIRIQYFWDIANIPEEVPDYYLNKHQSELRWIRWAMQAWQVPRANSSLLRSEVPQEELQSRLEFVHRTWVSNQSMYFASRAVGKARDARKLDRWRLSLFSLAVLGTILLIIVHALLFQQETAPELASTVQSRFILVLALLFVAGGMLSHHADKMSYSDEQIQYGKAHDIFREGSRQIERLLGAGELSRVQQLIREVGIESLQENGDWVKLHSLKPPDLPAS